jgi:tetratricopeptide (TPR) repeat protein
VACLVAGAGSGYGAGLEGDLDALVEDLRIGNRTGYEVFPPLPRPRAAAPVVREPAPPPAVEPSPEAASDREQDAAETMAEVPTPPVIRRTGDPAGKDALAADLFRQGTEALRARDFDHAIRRLTGVVRLDPGHAAAHTNLGAALLHGDRPQEALAILETAVALDPDEPRAWNNLGLAEWRTGRRAPAREHFLQAARLDPDSAVSLANLAALQRQEGAHEAALFTLRRALSRPLVPAQAHLQMGLLLETGGRADEAAAHYRAYVAMAGDLRPDLTAWLRTHLATLDGVAAEAVDLASDE